MKRIVAIAILLVCGMLCLAETAEARGRRGGCICDPSNCNCPGCPQGCPDCGSCSNGQCVVAQKAVLVVETPSSSLAILNRQRAAIGLFAYIEDPALTRAALACASWRAERRIAGHTSNDFVFLQGASSNTSGCACWSNDGTFGACAMYDRKYRYAGAATVVGPDGRAYHQLFVR